MVKLWQMDDFPQGDHRLPHMAFPPKYVTPERLKKRTGVFLWKIGLGTGEKANTEGAITQMEWINKEYKYVTDNVLEIKEGVTPRLNEKIQEWYEPHVHAFDESRLILEGQAYYDVEDPKTEKWTRILMERGDFIVIPAGCMHRFTPDMTNNVKMKRFYQTAEGEPHSISRKNSPQLIQRNDYLLRFESRIIVEEAKKGFALMKNETTTTA